MTAIRNAKGQFVKQVAPTVDPIAEIKAAILATVINFATDVYGTISKRTILKAYRTLFDADYGTSYDWLETSGMKI